MFRITVLAAALTLATPAFSADLVVPAEPQPVFEEAGYDWSGFYLGAQLGAQGVRAFAPGEGTIDGTAVVGGLFAGANWQANSMVLGAEADVEYSGFDETQPCGNPLWDCNAYVDWQGSLRGRLGFAADTLLFYGTAGVAFANVGGSTTSPIDEVFADESIRVGYTVGAGVEAAFTENLIGRFEYRYTNLGERDMAFDIVYPDVEVYSHAVRAGLAYKF